MDIWQPGFEHAPPFHALRPSARRVSGEAWPTLEQLNGLAATQNLVNAAGLPVRFETQTARCGQHDYEARILATGNVPTRTENWHDLLNAFCWLSLPHTKRALNAVQCQAINPKNPQRGPLSDAATLFDESGLVLAGPHAELLRALQARHWHEAFVTLRAAWKDMTVIVVGHAVLEKLLTPWPGITAKCTWIDLPALPALSTVDATLAQHWLGQQVTQPADLFPLPVLGVPGWWAENANPAFYANTQIFRPPR